MMRHKFLFAAFISICLSQPTFGQSAREAYRPACDSINSYLQAKTGVQGECRLRKVTRKGSNNDFYFTSTLGGYPLRTDDLKWIRTCLNRTTEALGRGKVRRIMVRTRRIEDLVTPEIGNDGKVPKYGKSIAGASSQFIIRLDAPKVGKGLSGRHIALWQSHGMYFSEEEGRWMWQRAPVHRTVEDIFTQSFVTPFLIPMLENAGAFVMSPRETDYNTEEVICDNDSISSSHPLRRKGDYREEGRWRNGGAGFADFKPSYTMEDCPFLAGSSRKAECRQSPNGDASAIWAPGFSSKWKGSVYISYLSDKNSSACALYKVHHLGGISRYIVDQTRGGGVWIRLGDFEMGPGSYVELSNGTPAGKTWRNGTHVSADAVRFGGGMGKFSYADSLETSGMPAWCEGALYNMPWSGVDNSVFTNFDRNYVNDYASRGAWVKYMKDEKRIPFDISLAFHTDAGVAGGDTTIGTLAIYTLMNERNDKTGDGVDRMAGRVLAEMVQSQVVEDIRARFRPDWNRRETWDKSYSESRTSDVPALLLELLSHQNYADMKYGLDPKFKFAVSRAVYKGILKYFSAVYKKPYSVQPLPVKDFSASLGDDAVMLSWSCREDPLEPTAVAGSYEVYVREDEGGWTRAATVKDTKVKMPLKKGHILSYRIIARNEGGASFPSETLSVGIPFGASKKALIVNAFTDIRGPKGFEDENYAGFSAAEDGGVPYIEDRSYAGEVYNFRRSDEWATDNDPGFGACWTDHIGERVAGNSFDYPYIHGKALMSLGCAFSSKSVSCFTGKEDCGIIDIIGGKQEHLFSEILMSALDSASGKNIIISGAGIAKDLDSTAQDFTSRRLGFKWQGSHPCRDGRLDNGMDIWSMPNSSEYCVENPCAIAPYGRNSRLFLRYKASRQGAGIFSVNEGSANVCFGFPLECLKNGTDIEKIMALCLNFFDL